jgi:hypothetical protein
MIETFKIITGIYDKRVIIETFKIITGIYDKTVTKDIFHLSKSTTTRGNTYKLEKH